MGEKKKELPKVWFSLKKSFDCKSDTSDVYTPKNKKNLSSILTKKTRNRSGCSRSISNLKDVIHGSKRHFEKPPSCSPRSIGSSEFGNPITHEVILSNSKCELKITGYGGFSAGGGGGGGGGGDGGSTYLGTLTPGTPGPRVQPSMLYFKAPNMDSDATPPRKKVGVLTERDGFASKRRGSIDEGSNGICGYTCHRCGEHFVKWEVLESHHLSKHALTELPEGDSSRKIVEIICRSSWLKADNQHVRIDKILKVHNMQRTLSRFEEHREMVKLKATKLAKKHPRCIADGNELLRFYGTTLGCSLGVNGSSHLCVSDRCCVCRIIRNGSFGKPELTGGIGVFTTSTSWRALECVEPDPENAMYVRKALIVCRVIAGRVHKPMENIQEIAAQTGFDSLAGKVGVYSNIEELYLLNPRALLPCFVVICKT
ncbi:hypothetical protein F511_04691 [Dorcoceras hygrometricum]|uniref:C2H2-type domain-containing protein n=1 Tax=Dorcoceras hygrometricum TaxID=472368 RepID=A0A2Z7B0X1_9LAMI|nr:hypothetical protein F511_04691 [Dorcoceras hygrometricum]